MGHEKRTKVIAILALIVAILGLSVGFSAYTKTLNIQNVQATVQGNENNFSVVFSTASDSASGGSVTGSFNGPPGDHTVNNATLSGTTISNLSFNSTTEGGMVIYDFYVYNNGTIPAYLTGITFGDKTCTGAEGTSSTLVKTACNSVNVEVKIGGHTYSSTTSGTTKITNSAVLPSKGSASIKVSILNYVCDVTPPDGDFTVKFGDITLNYSSQKSQ